MPVGRFARLATVLTAVAAAGFAACSTLTAPVTPISSSVGLGSTPGLSSPTAQAPAAASTDPGIPTASPSAPLSASPIVDPDDEGNASGSNAASPQPGLAIVGASGGVRLPGEPDPALTPGALNPGVTQATIGQTICVSGWTDTVRPPTAFTNALKIRQIGEYHYAITSPAAYEEDHLIPLQLGGAPADPRNLWPQPYTASLPDGRPTGARIKDVFETALKRRVCAGTLTLAAAQSMIGIHWVHADLGIAAMPGTGPTPSPGPTDATGTPPLTATPAPSARPTPSPSGGASMSVVFVSLPDPAVPGSVATMAARTAPGATCTAKVTWPSGRVSTAAGLQVTATAGSGGLVAWTWNVGSTTGAGTATAAVTCTKGSSASARRTFPVA